MLQGYEGGTFSKNYNNTWPLLSIWLSGRSWAYTLYPSSQWRLTSLWGCFCQYLHVPGEEMRLKEMMPCEHFKPTPDSLLWNLRGWSPENLPRCCSRTWKREALYLPDLISLWKTKQNDVPIKSGFLVLKWQSQIWGFAKFSWHIVIWKDQVSAAFVRHKWTIKGEDWVETLGIPRCPPVSEPGPRGGFPRQTLPPYPLL